MYHCWLAAARSTWISVSDWQQCGLHVKALLLQRFISDETVNIYFIREKTTFEAQRAGKYYLFPKPNAIGKCITLWLFSLSQKLFESTYHIVHFKSFILQISHVHSKILCFFIVYEQLRVMNACACTPHASYHAWKFIMWRQIDEGKSVSAPQNAQQYIHMTHVSMYVDVNRRIYIFTMAHIKILCARWFHAHIKLRPIFLFQL